MLQAFKDAYHRRARDKKRAALATELDGIYNARRYFNAREKQIMAEVKNLDAAEVHHKVHTRRARAW